MIELNININVQVRVRLTNYGRARFLQVRPNYPFDLNNGTIQLTLWELMEIFGPHMYHGSKQMFMENTITIGLQK